MNVLDHLPVLAIVVPMLCAPLCAIARRPALAWGVATLAVWCAAGVSLCLLHTVLTEGVVQYRVGNWPAPWGIELRMDLANALVLSIVALIGAVVMPYARLSVAREIPAHNAPLFYALLLLLVAGLNGILVTGDAFNLFVFLEISSLSTYALIAMGNDRRALTASFQYLIMGTIGASFYLIGVGFLYVMTGTLNMADLAERIPAVADTSTVRTAFAFIVTGICLKLALFPLHLWLPNAYTYAPSTVTALLGATATKVAVYVLIRYIYTIFGPHFSFDREPLSEILLLAAVVGILSASLVSIRQTNIKRMLAYSSVAQIGYIALGIGSTSSVGLASALLHMFNHALMKGALFMALGAVAYRMGGCELHCLRGLARTMPWTFAALVLGGLSLIGVPLTVGFISKWVLLQAAFASLWWLLVPVVLVGSVLAVVYVWRIVEAGWFGQPVDDTRREAPWGLLLPTWLLILANVYLGLDTRLTLGVAELAASQLFGSLP